MAAPPLLEAVGLVKQYGHVQALRGADFSVHAGEVLALIGDNGAGKSTLVRILSGAARPDAGEIHLNGEPLSLHSPTDAQHHGIETVYQDLALAPDLDSSANLFLGREIHRKGPLGWLGVLDNDAMRAQARAAFTELGVGLKDIRANVATLSGGQRQSVAVARSVAWAQKIVFLDEPTAALGVVQTGRVLDVVRRIRDRGIAVVLISHNMPQVIEVADRIEVLRMGRRVAQLSAAGATVSQLVGAMTGELDDGDRRP